MKQGASWITASAVALTAVFSVSSLRSTGSQDTPVLSRPADSLVAPIADKGSINESPGELSSVDRSCRNLQSLLASFLSVEKAMVAAPGSCNPDPAKPSSTFEFGATSPKLRVIIATLPDPIHTHLPLMFDRGTEAMQQAAQDSGYTYDSSWLPWDTEHHDYQNIADQDMADQRASKREDQPGVMLFRKALKAPEITPYAGGLVVFVVGEDATHGINAGQFENAAGWIASLRTQKALDDSDIQVLGPTFSGSLPSLAKLLGEDGKLQKARPSKHPQPLKVFSGQVSSNQDVAWFQAQFRQKPIEFHSFLQDDNLQLLRYLDFLDDSGLGTGPVAIVTEDETAYGASSNALGLQARKKSHRNDIDTFFYPRDISALRAAYQEQSVFTSGAARSSSDPQRHILRTDLADSEGKQHDTVRSYAGNQSALSQEAVLLQIVSMMREHKSEFVILISTNPLDQLFLAHFFKLAYPEGRIVVLGSDLLLRREVGLGGLHGILTLSTYPQLPQIDDWTHIDPQKDHSHRAFTQEGSQGVYVALRALLDPDVPVDPKVTFLPPDTGLKDHVPADYAPPFWLRSNDSPWRPSTWLSVLGNNGFWPIAALDHPLHDGETPVGADNNPPSIGAWPAPPLSMKVCIILTILWAFFHLLCLAMPSITVKPDHRSYFACLRKTDAEEPERSHTMLLVASSALLVIAATILASGFGWMALRDAPINHPLAYFFFPIVTWVIVAAALAYNTWLEDQLSAREHQALWFSDKSLWKKLKGLTVRIPDILKAAKFRLAWFTGITLVFLVLFYVFLDLPLVPEVKTLSYVRAMNLTTGVSPIVPLILLALGMYGWCWFSLRGFALFGPGKPCLPAAKDLLLEVKVDAERDEACKDVDPNGENLLTMMSEEGAGTPMVDLSDPFDSRMVTWAVIIFFTLLIAAGIISKGEPLRSVGLQTFPNFVSLWIAISISILLANSWQLWHLWLKLRNLLTFLDKLPLRRTLQGMHGFTWGSIWKMGGNVLDVRYQIFYRQFEAINHLRASLPHHPEGSNTYSETMQAWAKEIEKTHCSRILFAKWYAKNWDKWTARGLGELCDLQKDTAEAVGFLVTKVLVPAWVCESGSLLVPPPAKAGADGESAIPPSDHPYISNAEEVVCLLYLGFIQNILGRIRSLVLGIICLFLSIAFVLPSYPFDPRPVLTGAVIILFLIVGTAVVFVYSQMFRDATLSHLTNTKPGELGSEFWMKLVSFGVGPVFGLLATVFPSVSDFLLSWLQPSLSAMK